MFTNRNYKKYNQKVTHDNKRKIIIPYTKIYK